MRVGIDLVRVHDVQDALDLHGDRYLSRIYSIQEIDDCRDRSGTVSAARLAARFAAKEAVVKVLRLPADQAIEWNAIEVRRMEGGWPDLRLGGRAADLARSTGVSGLTVSMTHDGDYASAVVIGYVTHGGDRCR